MSVSATLVTEPDAMIEGSTAQIDIIASDTSINSLTLSGYDGEFTFTLGDLVDPETGVSEHGHQLSFVIIDDTLVDTTRSLSVTKVNGSSSISSYNIPDPLIVYPVIDNPQTDGFVLNGEPWEYDEIEGLPTYKWVVEIDGVLNFDLNINLYWHGWVTIPAGQSYIEVITYTAVEAVKDYNPKGVYEQIKPNWWNPVSFLED
ncbi:MAG: hypothetical protein IBX57_00940 [Gammaproteobacteria bacterium]|nr:hypothetical protein [Gammaproteobacteria bacterium]